MTKVGRLITREIFSLSTILFVVVPFALQLTGASPSLDPARMMSNGFDSLTSGVSMYKIESSIRTATKSQMIKLQSGGLSGKPTLYNR